MSDLAAATGVALNRSNNSFARVESENAGKDCSPTASANLQEVFLMKARAISAAMLLIMGMTSAFANVRIYDDRGGQIGQYLAKYQALRASGEKVEIDGTCASACTMLLGVVPRNRICVTLQAILVFHAAWDPTPGGPAVSNAGNRILWSSYPSDVRKWISRHGGLRTGMIYLSGPELYAMYPICR